MKRKQQIMDGLYAFLNSCKVLENGTDADIAAAKKDYKRIYKSRWRNQYRKKYTAVTIYLNKDEIMIIDAALKGHKRRRVSLIKGSCLAYLQKRFLIPDEVAIATIRQLLAMCYNSLQRLFDENLLPQDTSRLVLEQMQDLELKVLRELHNPKEIE